MLSRGAITDLQTQVVYQLVQGVKYVADFVYKNRGLVVVEDVKGFKTPVYKLKKKLMRSVLGIEIKEPTRMSSEKVNTLLAAAGVK